METAQAAAPPPSWQRVADAGALELNDGRLHLQMGGRYISIIQHEGQLYCIDSICFHAGGPLVRVPHALLSPVHLRFRAAVP